MFSLKRKMKEVKLEKKGITAGRVSIRDKLLVKEVQEMSKTLPSTCRVTFKDPDQLHTFHLFITPDDGLWSGGIYKFHIDVPVDYNNVPPKVSCETQIWHPNINEIGEVCLSLLRVNALSSLGWTPTRKLKDVVWGLNSLFSDLLNFDDPLNIQAAEQYEQNKDSFMDKVKEYVQLHAK